MDIRQVTFPCPTKANNVAHGHAATTGGYLEVGSFLTWLSDHQCDVFVVTAKGAGLRGRIVSAPFRLRVRRSSTRAGRQQLPKTDCVIAIVRELVCYAIEEVATAGHNRRSIRGHRRVSGGVLVSDRAREFFATRDVPHTYRLASATA